MKNVLVISYFFPPRGLGNSIHVTKIVKYLKNFGWNPVVLTAEKNRKHGRMDITLTDELPKDVTIVKTYSLEPVTELRRWRKFGKRQESNSSFSKISSLGRYLKFFFLIPDEHITWLAFAVVAGLNAIKRENIEIIFSTGPPHTSHLIGYLLHRMTKKAWLVEFQDDWQNNPFLRFPTVLHKKIHALLEKIVVSNAWAVNIASRDFSYFYPKMTDKFYHITLGYDEEDFKNISSEQNNKFEILYVGTIYVNIKIEPFFIALKRLFDEKPEIKNHLIFRFIGASYQEDLNYLSEKYGIQENVKISSDIPHREISQHLVNASVLLILLGSTESDKRCYPGKVFEYLRAKRPILAIIPEGILANLIRKMDAGKVIHSDNIGGIKEAIRKFYLKWQRNELTLPSERPIEQFEIKLLVEKLSQILETLSQNG